MATVVTARAYGQNPLAFAGRGVLALRWGLALLFVSIKVAQWVKNPPAIQEMQETQIRFQGWEDPLEKEMATHCSILPGESHGQRSLADYSPGGHIELDLTEATELASKQGLLKEWMNPLLVYG